ncbi:MAG: sulfur carrier protein ThiS adenylyltransferase ThiF [Fibrobacterota bacterium]
MKKLRDLFRQHYGKKNYEKIENTVIGIGGAGGLGSNCAFNLVRAGFRHFYIYDFDTVELSNLNRQFFFHSQCGRDKVSALAQNLTDILPDIHIHPRKIRITEHTIDDLFAPCDVVVEACDTVESKRLIVETFLHSPKLLITASGLAGWGNMNQIEVRRISKTVVSIGDFKNEACPKTPPVSPRVNAVAAMQADAILDIIINT